jgi:hypothetical protein
MAKYQYTTVAMKLVGSLNEGQPWVRWVKDKPESTFYEVLAEYAEKGWRYVGVVERGAAGTDQIIFEREAS